MNKTDIKIVSGAQTGVDQGALRAAIDLGITWGGWVPRGWRTENGTVGGIFRPNMRELGSTNYLVRTRRNVADSHATLILTISYPLTGGTLKTRQFCQELMRSHFVACPDEAEAVQKTRNWLLPFFAEPRQTPFVLNVAGPRESKSPGIGKLTRHFILEVLQGLFADESSEK